MSIFKTGLFEQIVSLKCYSCSNYGRIKNDLIFTNSCSNPSSAADQSLFCTGSFCFVIKNLHIFIEKNIYIFPFKKSQTLLADLSYAIIRGCVNSPNTYDVPNRLIGYDSSTNICKSNDFCNNSKGLHSLLNHLLIIFITVSITLKLFFAWIFFIYIILSEFNF